jgi:hypothetical protein
MKRYNLIKIWLLIGIGLSFFYLFLHPIATIIRIVIDIILFVLTLERCKEASKPSDLNVMGVLVLLFSSIIGGIIILTTNESHFLVDDSDIS